MPKRVLGLWLMVTIMLLDPVAGSQGQGVAGDEPVAAGPVISSGPGPRSLLVVVSPRDVDALLWEQPLSATNTQPYANQHYEPSLVEFDVYLADDFANLRPWLIDSFFVPGDTFRDGCHLGCADLFTWQIYADAGGVPDGDPTGGGNAPVWQISLPPTDPQVTISYGSGGWLSNVRLDLSDPVNLPAGTWWLVFYPDLNFGACGCQYGRQVSDSADGHAAQVINPGEALGFPPTWTSVQAPSTWGLAEQDLAFRLEGESLLDLGDWVWYDTDQDGIQDAGEPGVPGIAVDVYDNGSCAGVPLESTATDAAGFFGFVLEPGTYCLDFHDLPTGWFITPQNQGDDEASDSDARPETGQIANIYLTADDLDEDVGVYTKGSVGDTVWCDADYSGTLDAGEGVAGVTVGLHKDDNCNGVSEGLLVTRQTVDDGRYLFSGLKTGPLGSPVCYVAKVNVDDMGECNQPIAATEHAVALDVGDPDEPNADFGFYRFLRLGDRVWYDTDQDGIQDPGEPGVPGVWIDVHDNGDCTGSALASTTTDGSGHYEFGLLPGTYCLQFYNVPAGWLISPQNQGGDDALDSDPGVTTGQIKGISLAADDGSQGMGVYAEGSIGDTVWCDASYDGLYDPGEGLAGVPVRLYADTGCDGEAEGLLATESTVGDGLYLLKGLSVGPVGSPVCYVVAVDPADMGVCDQPIQSSTHNTALDVVDHEDLDGDFGFVKVLELGDRVWYDTDRNGLQDTGEPGMAGIGLDLHDNGTCGGIPLESTTTDASGVYAFESLQAGMYCLQVRDLPVDWKISPQAQGDDRLDSDADPTSERVTGIDLTADDLDKDVGVYVEGSIGDTVWCDVDHNGAFDAGEGVAGVMVSLYEDVNCDLVPDGLLSKQDTVGDGQYLFEGLYPGPAGSRRCFVVGVDRTDMGECDAPITSTLYGVPLSADQPHDLGNDFGFRKVKLIFLPIVLRDSQ